MRRQVLGRQWDNSPEGIALRHDLGVKRESDARRAKHPRSGFPVEVGRHERLVHGSSPPEVSIREHGHFDGKGGTGRPPLGMIAQEVERRPLKYVYRGVSEDDYQGILQRRQMKSDGRGNICSDEGTCASDDPRSAATYGRDNPSYRVLKIRVHPDDGWHVDPRDGYVKTPNAIPADRIVRATRPLPGRDAQ